MTFAQKYFLKDTCIIICMFTCHYGKQKSSNSNAWIYECKNQNLFAGTCTCFEAEKPRGALEHQLLLKYHVFQSKKIVLYTIF